MIRVTVQDNDGDILAQIAIERLGGLPDARQANYSVRTMIVHPNGDEAAHQTNVQYFERLEYNVLGLVKEALLSLSEYQLEVTATTIPGTVKHGGVGLGGIAASSILREIGPVRE